MSTPMVKSKCVQDLMDPCLRGAGLVRHFGTGENIVLHLQLFEEKKEGLTQFNTHTQINSLLSWKHTACRTHLHLDLGALRLACKQRMKDRSSAFQILGSLPLVATHCLDRGLLEL